MKILCNVHKTGYKKKPTGIEVGSIQNELTKPEEIELENLFKLICNGCTFRSAAVNGKGDDGFISQQIFGVDIDNSKGKEPIQESERLMPEQAIDKAKQAGLYANFLYPTFSDSKELRKFRILFVLDMPIIDPDLRNRIAGYIINIFGTAADSKCGNPARLFFGTNKQPVLEDVKNINKLDDILKLIPKEIKVEAPKEKEKQKTQVQNMPINWHKGNNIDLIKQHDWQGLRKKLKREEKIIFDNKEAFFDYLYKEIDPANLLEISNPKSFNCIFHDDKNRSASIFKTDLGTWQYKCFSEDANMNIKHLIERIGNFKSEYRALEFIKNIYNLEIKQTDWSKEQIENIEAIIRCITRTNGEGFSVICPTADKITKNAQIAYLQILIIAKDTIFPEREAGNEGNIIFYMSDEQLMKACRKNHKSQVYRYIKLLSYHEMLIPLDDTEVPKNLLNKVKKQKLDEKHHHISFYSIPSWVFERTKLIEEQGKKWKENGYKIKGISYEMFYRKEGAEIAGKLYPQHKIIITQNGLKQRTTSKNSDKLYYQTEKIIFNLLKQQGYCTEKQIIETMILNNFSKEKAEYRLKQYLPKIIDQNKLTKKRCNNELKKRFNIQTKKNSFPTIIFLQ